MLLFTFYLTGFVYIMYVVCIRSCLFSITAISYSFNVYDGQNEALYQNFEVSLCFFLWSETRFIMNDEFNCKR